MQKDALFPQETHLPLLSVASTEIYKPEQVPLTLAQAQNALPQTHVVPSKSCKTATAQARWGGSHCTISITGEGGLESVSTFPGFLGCGDLMAA